MKIAKIFMVLVLVGVTFSCSISEDYSKLDNSNEAVEDSRGTRNLPETKYVTVPGGIKTYRALPQEVAHINFRKLTYNYSDEHYEGVLYGSGSLNDPEVDGEYLIFRIPITYCGTVKLKEVKPIPKEVRVIHRGVVEFHRPQDVAGNLYRPREIYYSNSGFKGWLKDSYIHIVSASPTNDGRIRFVIDITYSGTVYKN